MIYRTKNSLSKASGTCWSITKWHRTSALLTDTQYGESLAANGSFQPTYTSTQFPYILYTRSQAWSKIPCSSAQWGTCVYIFLLGPTKTQSLPSLLSMHTTIIYIHNQHHHRITTQSVRASIHSLARSYCHLPMDTTHIDETASINKAYLNIRTALGSLTPPDFTPQHTQTHNTVYNESHSIIK